jgi:hypothetical protein
MTTMARPIEVQKILVRLPSDVKAWLQAECAKNLTSYSSQVTIVLRDKMGAQQKAEA